MNPRQCIVFVFLLAVLFVAATCGKKGPPFLPDKEIPFRIEQLKATCENEAFYLKGTVVDPQDRAKDIGDIAGCRIYHVCYPVDNPPCEGCPIDYGPFKEIKGELVTQGDFSCRAPVKKTRGVHFFQVRLMGQKGEMGPFSDRAKIIIE